MSSPLPRRILQIAGALSFFGAAYFASAGSLSHAGAWCMLALYAAGISLSFLVVPPDLIAERTHITKGAKNWDKPLSAIVGFIGPALIWLIAGLDARFAWSPPMPLWIRAAGFVLCAAAIPLMAWAMASNRFFTPQVAIQRDRGHTVVTTGPYRFVRHPGYTGMSALTLGTPAVLGSRCAFGPAALTVAVLLVRTALEDRMLRSELDDYGEYAKRTRWRLIPGIW